MGIVAMRELLSYITIDGFISDKLKFKKTAKEIQQLLNTRHHE